MKNYTQAYTFLFILVFISSLIENPHCTSTSIVILQGIIESVAVVLIAWFLVFVKKRYS
jgi:predicted membrane protein